jgi:hypothetical protein
MEARGGVCLSLVGEVEGAQGGVAWGRPQGALEEPRLAPGFEQMGGIRMPEGREGATHCSDTGALFGCAEGALDTGATQRGSRRRPLAVIAPGGGQEPGGGTRGCPGGAEPPESLGGQGDVPVLGALATMDMALEALPIEVRDLQGESLMEPEAQARDGGKGDLVVPGGGRLPEPLDLLHPEDGGETVGGWRTPECQEVPGALEDVRRAKADATGAETHGRGGEAVDLFPVQEVVLECLCREAVGGCVGELSPQTDCPDRGGRSPFALATELESRDHVLTQWGQERSPSRS